MSWGMFTAIPSPYKKWDSSLYPMMLVCLPLIGLVVGALWTLGAWLISLAEGLGLIGAAIMTVLPYLITGFIHLDGFMDCFDAILSRRSIEERRRILKDPHVGSFSVISVCILMLLTFSLFSEADFSGKLLCLMFIPAVSRAAAALAILLFEPMEGSVYAKMFNNDGRKKHVAAVCALLLVFAAMPTLIYGSSGVCTAAVFIGSFAAILAGRKNLGGMSGDIAGASITIGELLGIAALAFI